MADLATVEQASSLLVSATSPALSRRRAIVREWALAAFLVSLVVTIFAFPVLIVERSKAVVSDWPSRDKGNTSFRRALVSSLRSDGQTPETGVGLSRKLSLEPAASAASVVNVRFTQK